MWLNGLELSANELTPPANDMDVAETRRTLFANYMNALGPAGTHWVLQNFELAQNLFGGHCVLREHFCTCSENVHGYVFTTTE